MAATGGSGEKAQSGITRLLLDWRDGDRAALDQLIPQVYDELRRLAGRRWTAEGAVLITVNDFDKSGAIRIARDLHRMGFEIFATGRTAVAWALIGVVVAWRRRRDG